MFAKRVGKGTHLRWIDDHHRQTSGRQLRCCQPFKPARCLERDALRRKIAQPCCQLIDAVAGVLAAEALAGRHDMHVEPILRDVNANKMRVHLVPSLSKRASFAAAQATVRVRWNGGLDPGSPTGLVSPGGCGLASATAPTMIADAAGFNLQGGTKCRRGKA